MAQQPSPEKAKGASIAGQVLNSKTDEPIRRANLTLMPMQRPGGGAVMMAPGGPPPSPYTATTDAEGKYRIENIEPGTYRLMAERQGFLRQQYGETSATGMSPGTPLQVTNGQELKSIDLKMIPYAVITGRILDEEGEPVPRAQVQAMRRRYMQGRQQLMPMGGGMTNDVGEYRMAELAPGKYWIAATRMRMGGFEAASRNAGNKPEEDYVLTYYPSASDQAAARAIDVEAGQQLTGMDIRLQKDTVYRIRGKVTGAPDSVQRMRVMLMPRDRNSAAGAMSLMGAGGMVRDDGTFEIPGVRPGSYNVAAASVQGMMAVLAKAPVDVGRENVEGVVLTVGTPLTLTGKIRLVGEPPAQEPGQEKAFSISNARIQLMPMEGFVFGMQPATPKADGTFTIENVGADKYRFQVFNTPPGTYIKSIRAGGTEVLDTGLDLSSGAGGAVEITLSAGAGKVGGSVMSGQQAAAGAMIILTPDPARPDRPDLQKMAAADQTGQFSIMSVPPGNYRIFAWSGADYGEASDPEILKQHESEGVRVTVRENGQEQVNLKPIVVSSGPAK